MAPGPAVTFEILYPTDNISNGIENPHSLTMWAADFLRPLLGNSLERGILIWPQNVLVFVNSISFQFEMSPYRKWATNELGSFGNSF